MPKKLNISAKIAPDVLLQKFRFEEFYFFGFKIFFFRKYLSYPNLMFKTTETLVNKGIKKNNLLNVSP